MELLDKNFKITDPLAQEKRRQKINSPRELESIQNNWKYILELKKIQELKLRTQ